MKLVGREPDRFKGTVTFEIGDGRYLTVDADIVREIGVAGVAKMYGVEAAGGRVQVWRGGRMIGTVPAAWHPMQIRSTTILYEPRSGDFTWDGESWQACLTLCPGDFDAIPDFIREDGK